MRSPAPASRLRRPLIGLVAVAAALALTGCGIINRFTGNDPFDLAVGDCLAEDPVNAGGDVYSVDVVDCSDPHYAEVYESFIIDDGGYPGEMEVSALAEEWCLEDFGLFVGVEWEFSELDFDFLYPTAESWEEIGDREILCMAYDPGGETVGTLQGANR